MELWPGSRYPLGATWDGTGTNFSIFSEHCDGIELCLLEAQGSETRFELSEVTASVWHGYLPGVGPGCPYGYRVHGPYLPSAGHRFDATKLLLDPYSKAIDGEVECTPDRFSAGARGEAAIPGGARGQGEDSRQGSPPASSVVVDGSFDWEDDKPPGVPWHETTIYETHVRGATVRHPAIPDATRGTFAGLSHPAVLDHLQKMSITAVELLPVHHFVQPRHLLDRSLRNYWGYDSIGYFAPHAAYSSSGVAGQQVVEFKEMVKAFHSAGIEIILDVVYNHTGEGNHLGPTLCFRGIDNSVYYRLAKDNQALYVDFTGTGNTMNAPHPQVLKLIMDSLRYWVLEMHVDGFRFDLTSALARELFDVDHLSSFLDIIHQDPVLSTVKLIAEPWDLGEGGYQVGNFPGIWSEWNGMYRDAIRDFWRGRGGTVEELAARFTGSSDLYQPNGRRPYASINYVTCHDGFTLADLVSYEQKHNEANGQRNRDGEDDNRSWNCGHEGPTDDASVIALRDRQRRNFVAMLALSQGVPMLLGGDELGRTQRGNNNAYCQDNETSWFDWEGAEKDPGWPRFVRRALRLRQQHATFTRRDWLHQGPQEDPSGNIVWFGRDGAELSAERRREPARAVGVLLRGHGIASSDVRGGRIDDDDFMILLNALHEEASFSLPAQERKRSWSKVLDTSEEDGGEEVSLASGAQLNLPAKALIVLEASGSTPPGPAPGAR